MLRIACSAVPMLLAVVLAAPASSQGDGRQLHDLHTQAAKGTTVWFVETRTSVQEQTVQGTEAKITAQVERTFRITIKQVDSRGNRIAELELVRVTGSMDLPGLGERSFDSVDIAATEHLAKAPVLGGWVKRVTAGVDRPFVARIDAQGRLAGSMAGVAHEMMRAGPATSLTDREMVGLAEAAFARLPDKPVPIGGRWRYVQSVRGNRPMERHASMTLKAVDDDSFTLSFGGTIEKAPLLPSAKPEPGAGVGGDGPVAGSPKTEAARVHESLRVSNGKVHGDLRVSRKDGMAIEASTGVTADIEMALSAGQVTMKMQTLTKLRRTSKSKALDQLMRLRVTRCVADAKLIAGAVRSYYVKRGGLPASLEDLAKRDERGRSELEELPKDPWRHPYELVLGDTPRYFAVVSAGPDGKQGTEDDISNRSKRR